MWAIRVDQAKHIQLRCSASKTAACNVMLVPVQAHAARLRGLRTQPIIDSGSYRHGFVATDVKNVPEGNYIMVVSTFNPGQCGAFRVQVFSSAKLKVERVP